MAEDLTEVQARALRNSFMALGFNYLVADALVEQGVGEAEVLSLSKDTVLNHFLCHQGIIGFTDVIREAVFNINVTQAHTNYMDREWPLPNK